MRFNLLSIRCALVFFVALLSFSSARVKRKGSQPVRIIPNKPVKTPIVGDDDTVKGGSDIPAWADTGITPPTIGLPPGAEFSGTLEVPCQVNCGNPPRKCQVRLRDTCGQGCYCSLDPTARPIMAPTMPTPVPSGPPQTLSPAYGLPGTPTLASTLIPTSSTGNSLFSPSNTYVTAGQPTDLPYSGPSIPISGNGNGFIYSSSPTPKPNPPTRKPTATPQPSRRPSFRPTNTKAPSPNPSLPPTRRPTPAPTTGKPSTQFNLGGSTSGNQGGSGGSNTNPNSGYLPYSPTPSPSGGPGSSSTSGKTGSQQISSGALGGIIAGVVVLVVVGGLAMCFQSRQSKATAAEEGMYNKFMFAHMTQQARPSTAADIYTHDNEANGRTSAVFDYQDAYAERIRRSSLAHPQRSSQRPGLGGFTPYVHDRPSFDTSGDLNVAGSRQRPVSTMVYSSRRASGHAGPTGPVPPAGKRASMPLPPPVPRRDAPDVRSSKRVASRAAPHDDDFSL